MTLPRWIGAAVLAVLLVGALLPQWDPQFRGTRQGRDLLLVAAVLAITLAVVVAPLLRS